MKVPINGEAWNAFHHVVDLKEMEDEGRLVKMDRQMERKITGVPRKANAEEPRSTTEEIHLQGLG